MPRKAQLAALLADVPGDVFLHYALACELLKLGEAEAGFARFTAIHAQFPEYVPAWFRHAQLLAEHGDTAGARTIAERGLETARRVGDDHAAGEIAEFLAILSNG